MNHLVIIDLQAQFEPSDKVVTGVLKAINKAKSQDFYIHFVEFAGYGKTLKILQDATKEYPYKDFIKKYGNDGGWEIMQSVYYQDKYRNFTPSPIWICGVNLCACVVESLHTMIITDMEKRIEDRKFYVLKDAVGCHPGHNWKIKRGRLQDNCIYSTNKEDIGEYWRDLAFDRPDVEVQTYGKMKAA